MLVRRAYGKNPEPKKMQGHVRMARIRSLKNASETCVWQESGTKFFLVRRAYGKNPELKNMQVRRAYGKNPEPKKMQGRRESRA